MAGNLSRRAARLSMQIPIALAIAFGLSFMLPRFALVLKQNLLERPAEWQSFLLLVLLVGSVSLVVVAVCAAVGALVGVLVRRLFAHRLTARPTS